MKFNVNLPGYEDLSLEVDPKGFIKNYYLQGSSKTLQLFQHFKLKYGDQITQWPPLVENQNLFMSCSKEERRSLLLLQGLLFKIQDHHQIPYSGEIVCDCRQVSSEVIDQALIASASNIEEIATWTTACTSCTSCKNKIEEMIQYRIPKKIA